MKNGNPPKDQKDYWLENIDLKYRQIRRQDITIILVLVGIAINVWLSK